MTGLEYMRTVCPTTSIGKDPNREDVQDAFEDGIAEGYKRAMSELKAKIDLVKKNGTWDGVDVDAYMDELDFSNLQ